MYSAVTHVYQINSTNTVFHIIASSHCSTHPLNYVDVKRRCTHETTHLSSKRSSDLRGLSPWVSCCMIWKVCRKILENKQRRSRSIGDIFCHFSELVQKKSHKPHKEVFHVVRHIVLGEELVDAFHRVRPQARQRRVTAERMHWDLA